MATAIGETWQGQVSTAIMRYGQLQGLDKKVSRLIMGCDNKLSVDDGAPLWDAFVAAGGTAFDTAYVYGAGDCERALGAWLQREGLGDKVVVTAKGAHTPDCDPDNLVQQLTESLDRLQLNRADIYIMHRDNLDIPVGEFVDVLNQQVEAGRIGLFGGSNWTVDRFRAANDYATANGKQGFAILNNNLSLAHMLAPLWPGCISASDDATLAFLRQTGTPHFSWSSQARGYFYESADADSLPEGTRPDECFGGDDNRERRRRARALGEKLGVSAGHIATAYVLNQLFPSFALIGPRTVEELTDTLKGGEVNLSPAQLAWLNLRDGNPPD